MTASTYVRKPGCCRDCGTATADQRSSRCRDCANTARRKPRRYGTCDGCGGPKKRGARALCAPCYRTRLVSQLTCPTCRGRKARLAKQCADCARAVQRERERRKLSLLVRRYRGAQLARHFDREALGWTIREAAARAGLHEATIRSWINGTHDPHDFELAALMRVLAFERCRECGSLGWIDPSEQRRRKTG